MSADRKAKVSHGFLTVQTISRVIASFQSAVGYLVFRRKSRCGAARTYPSYRFAFSALPTRHPVGTSFCKSGSCCAGHPMLKARSHLHSCPCYSLIYVPVLSSVQAIWPSKLKAQIMRTWHMPSSVQDDMSFLLPLWCFELATQCPNSGKRRLQRKSSFQSPSSALFGSNSLAVLPGLPRVLPACR